MCVCVCAGVVDDVGMLREPGLQLSSVVSVPALNIPASTVAVSVGSGNGTVQRDISMRWTTSITPVRFVTLNGVSLTVSQGVTVSCMQQAELAAKTVMLCCSPTPASGTCSHVLGMVDDVSCMPSLNWCSLFNLLCACVCVSFALGCRPGVPLVCWLTCL